MAAPVFSAALSIAAIDIPHFANPEISYTVDGCGMKGVCSQQLTFNLPSSEYSADDFCRYDEVILSVAGVTLPKFYLSDKSPQGAYIKVTCYDRGIFADRITTISESDIDSGYMSVGTLIPRLAADLGCSISAGDIIPVISKVPKDKIIGKRLREILSDLAEAACGYFALYSDTLSFIPFVHDGALYSSVNALGYSSIIYGLSKSVSAVSLTDGSRIFSTGTALDPAANLNISTEYASSELMGALVNTYSGKSYRAWGCSHVLLDDYPPPGGSVTFGDTVISLNYLRIKISPYGLYASCGNNSVPAEGFASWEKRELEKRIKVGETNGSTKITRDGMKFVYINENKARSTESTDTEEYGFSVGKGGLAQFEGAMIDKILPGKVEKLSNTSRKIVYSDKEFVLSWELDASGNKCNFAMEEVSE